MAMMNDLTDPNNLFNILQQSFSNLTNDPIFTDLKNEYISINDFNVKFTSNYDLSFLHLNIHSLNSKLFKFIEFIKSFELQFDVIVLSEIWATNIDMFHNILPGYTFIYDTPTDSAVGGVGMYINSNLIFTIIDNLHRMFLILINQIIQRNKKNKFIK